LATFANGRTDGAVTERWQNGQKSDGAVLVDGHKEGTAVHYNEDGSVWSYYCFKKGEQIGTRKCWANY